MFHADHFGKHPARCFVLLLASSLFTRTAPVYARWSLLLPINILKPKGFSVPLVWFIHVLIQAVQKRLKRSFCTRRLRPMPCTLRQTVGSPWAFCIRTGAVKFFWRPFTLQASGPLRATMSSPSKVLVLSWRPYKSTQPMVQISDGNQQLWHQTTFTPSILYTKNLYTKQFYIKHLLHETTFTPNTF